MKKRRLTIAVFTLLTALLLVSPVIASSTFGNVDVEKSPEETASQATKVYNHMQVGNLVFVEMGYGKWIVPACTHTKTITYFDTDTSESGFLCAKCGHTEKFEDQILTASGANIVTSATIRTACVHVYSGWGKNFLYPASAHLYLVR